MKLKKICSIVLLVVSIIGVIASVVMLLSAIRFMEWGRVIAYFMTAAVSVELLIWSALKLRKGA